MFAKWGGGEVLKRAVRGMLPKNRLRRKRLARLKVFEGVGHPYEDNLIRFYGKVHTKNLGPTTQVLEALKSPDP